MSGIEGISLATEMIMCSKLAPKSQEMPQGDTNWAGEFLFISDPDSIVFVFLLSNLHMYLFICVMYIFSISIGVP